MPEVHTLAGLKRKRAQIAGIIADHEKKARHWKAALTHVDATLRLFSSEIDPETIPAKRMYRASRYFSGDELARFCLDQLRRASAPITAGAIYGAAVKAHGIPTDARAKVTITERILRYMREKQEAGMVEKHGITHDAKWSLANADFNAVLPLLPDDAANSR
ncbi:MAG: hypothetical protein Q8L22_20320 [Reyranella sp.]|nr:hypothetical protein [Reyranella sp.]